MSKCLNGEKCGYSLGFSPCAYNQIVVFANGNEFEKIIAANSNMTAIIGADDYTRKNFPGVFIAGIKANSHTDK